MFFDWNAAFVRKVAGAGKTTARKEGDGARVGADERSGTLSGRFVQV